MAHLNGSHFDDDDDDDDDDSYDATDRIRRSYHVPIASSSATTSSANRPASMAAGELRGETIQVTLNEGYFASERRLFINSLANVRQKLNSLQMFNPAKNEQLKQQQEEQWNEKEKYTLDSLNEFKVQLDDKFQWNRPEDGREVWPSKLQYFLAITSYSIGLGNVIRFPILVQKNGGLAFIIPFVIMLLLEGVPLFYLELAIGQRMRKAAISCWHSVSPLAAGIGLAGAAVSFLIGLYYNTMVAWTLIYACASATNKFAKLGECPASGAGAQKAKAPPYDKMDSTGSAHDEQPAANLSATSGADECQSSSPFEFYWFRETLDVTGDISDWSHFNWPVVACLSAAWLISYLCLVRGLSSSKRLVYIISIFPYVILVVFFFKSINLRGMGHGVRYLFEPDVFFSLGLGFGGLIALSSYNSINNNCYKDAIKVSLINFITSLLAGVVIFSILGFRATNNYDKCQLEREQQIEFYLADYNLKVLDYGAVFKQVPVDEEAGEQRWRTRRHTAQESTTTTTRRPEAKKSKKNQTRQKQQQQQQRKTNTTKKKGEEGEQGDKINSGRRKNKSRPAVGVPTEFMAATPGEQNNSNSATDYQNKTTNTKDDDALGPDDEGKFSSDDAIASIVNLDKQLDLGSPKGSFDYGDADTEFVLNASNLINRQDLERIIGNIRNLQKCSIQAELEASTQGTGLVFVVIAEAINQFDANDTLYLSASAWALLFFLMILALGLDSQFGNLEGLLSSLTDLNFFELSAGKPLANGHSIGGEPQAARQQRQAAAAAPTNGLEPVARSRSMASVRQYATGVICLVSLLLSVVLFAHGAGSYMFAIFDEYASNFSLILIALFELLAISYIYGLKRFCDDCELMTGQRPPFIVLLSWRYISPILLLVIILTTIKQFTTELNYDVWSAAASSPAHLVTKSWPTWSIAFGACLIVCCVIWIPLVAILRIMRVNLIPDSQQQRCWFPAEELKEFHQLQDQERQVTRMERILFGFKPDDD